MADENHNPTWHSLSHKDCLEHLASSKQGLKAEEAKNRLKKEGPNKLPQKKRSTIFIVFLRQFKDPLIYILLIAGLISLGIGNYNNAIFIFAVLLLNSIIGTIQEWKAETSARSLEEAIQVTANVLRDGEITQINAEKLVPGDVVQVESGSSAPADLRLLESKNLRVDESLLTGESLPVEKDAKEDVKEDASVGDRKNMLHAGSSVMSGRAKGLVCLTGGHTEVGKIAKSLVEGEEALPPLVVKMKAFTRNIAIVILCVVILLAIFQYYQGANLKDIFFLAVALAVSAIPAGLPVAMTVALSIASSRMAKRKVIVRRLPAVEGLGSCTLIASDKTGTLTANILTVKRLISADHKEAEIKGEGYNLKGEIKERNGDKNKKFWQELVETGALCNEGELKTKNSEVETSGDTVDVALLVLAQKGDLARKKLLEKYEELGRIPFESENKFAASIHKMNSKAIAHVKGAADKILEMCANVDKDKQKEMEEELAKEGFRIIAFARGEVKDKGIDDYKEEDLKDLNFLGFAALIDPIRKGVKEAVKSCHDAGIEVRMVTGDHPRTGLSIGQEIGLASKKDKAVTGDELEKAKSNSGKDVHKAAVFARVEPSQKSQIVETLQDAGHFVAVTGDGVNDAPALRKANIGIAMGKGGTDVARGASDLILSDNNFASIVAGIEEGRIAYDNIRKVIWLLLSTGAAEVILFLLSLLTGLPLPLNPVQLLWLNLVTNGVQDVALAFEKGEGDVLKRPPRPTKQPIFDRQMIEQVLLSGAYIGLVAFAVYFYLFYVLNFAEIEARNLLLLLMVLFENIHIFSCRSERHSLFKVRLFSNPLLIITVIVAQGVHILSMFTPGISEILEIAPVSITTWAYLLMIAATLLVFDEIMKIIKSKFRKASYS